MNVYQRGQSFHVYFRIHGKTFRESARTSDRSEALLYLSRRYAEEAGRSPNESPCRFRVGDAVALWDTAVNGSKGKGWPAKRYGNVLHWSQWYGESKPVQGVKCREVSSYAEHRTSVGMSPSTIQKDFSSLASFFGWLVHEEHLGMSPVRGAKRPSLERGKKRGLEMEQARRGFETIKDHPVLEPAYLLAFAQGLRRSEIVRVRFEHVDLSRRTIYVEGSKTDRSQWTLPLHPRLESWTNANWQEKGPLVRKQRIRNGECEHFSPTSLENYRREANLRGWNLPNWHLGRHTLASNLVREGIDIFTVCKLLRHSQVTTTHSFYAHLRPDTRREELARFDF